MELRGHRRAKKTQSGLFSRQYSIPRSLERGKAPGDWAAAFFLPNLSDRGPVILVLDKKL